MYLEMVKSLLDPQLVGLFPLASPASKWIACLLSAFSHVTSIQWYGLDLLAFGMVLLDFSNPGFS